MKVAAINEQLREKRMEWFGHVMKKDEGHITYQAMKGNYTKSRRKLRKLERLNVDMKEMPAQVVDAELFG